MRKILLPPVVLALCLVGMVAVNYYGLAGRVWLSGPATFAGYALILLGIFVAGWSVYLFRRHETNIIPYKEPEHIVTAGPFRFSRHPMYLGMLLVLVGAAMLYGTALSLLFPLTYFIVANWWYIPFEEGKMADVFGEAFTAYKARVRRWL